MAIWSNTPVGFAMQNKIGPGIEVKPIDIRAFLDDTRGARSGLGKASSAAEDKEKPLKTDGLVGADNMIQQMNYEIESAMNNDASNFDKYLNAPESQKEDILKTIQDQQRQLATAKMQLPVLIASSKDQKKLLDADQAIVNKNQTGRQIIVSEELSNAQIGIDFMNNVDSIDAFNDSGRFKLDTYEEGFNRAKEKSYVMKDPSTGNYAVSPYKRINVNQLGTNDFLAEIRTKIEDAGVIQEITFDGQFPTPEKMQEILNTGTYTKHTFGSNEKNQYDVVTNAYEVLSPAARAHVMANVLKGMISYTDGTMVERKDADGKEILYKEGDKDLFDADGKQIHKVGDKRMILKQFYMPGTEATAEVLKARNEIAVGKKVDGKRVDLSPEEIKKIQDRGLMYANGIINTAKNYAYSIASGQEIGLTTLTQSYSEEINKGQGTDGSGKGGATELNTMLASATPMTQNYLMENASGTGTQNVKDANVTQFDFRPEFQQIVAQKMFGDSDVNKLVKEPQSLDALNMIIIDGVPTMVKPLLAQDSKYESRKGENYGIIGFGPKGYQMPMFENTPLTAGGSYTFRPIVGDGQRIQSENYIEMRVILPGNTKLGTRSKGDVNTVEQKTLKDMYDNRGEYSTLNISVYDDKTFGEDTYAITVLTPMSNPQSESSNSNKATKQQSVAYHEVKDISQGEATNKPQYRKDNLENLRLRSEASGTAQKHVAYIHNKQIDYDTPEEGYEKFKKEGIIDLKRSTISGRIDTKSLLDAYRQLNDIIMPDDHTVNGVPGKTGDEKREEIKKELLKEVERNKTATKDLLYIKG